MAKDKSSTECTRMCVKDGQRTRWRPTRRSTRSKDAKRNLQSWQVRKLRVKGTVKGDSVTVDSVAPQSNTTVEDGALLSAEGTYYAASNSVRCRPAADIAAASRNL